MTVMPNDLPTPGAYLRMRREAQQLSLDDVALIFGTVPSVPFEARVAMIEAIEADLSPITDDVAVALLKAAELGSFSFDPLVLIRLVDLHAGSPLQIELPRLCRTCGCSEFDPCYREGLHSHTVTCGWAGDGRCDACGPDDGDSGEETSPPANVPVNDQAASAAA